MSESPLLTRDEAAAFCRVSLDSFDAHVRPGLRTVKIGRMLRFWKTDVEKIANVVPMRRRGGGRPSQGWALRPPRTAGCSFTVRFRHRGKDYEFTTGTNDRAEAEKLAAHYFARVTTPPTLDGPGVYAIRAGRLMKIGMSRTSMRRRIAQLQANHGEQFVVLGVISGFPADEERVLNALRPFHVRGEWFETNPVLERLILQFCERGLP